MSQTYQLSMLVSEDFHGKYVIAELYRDAVIRPIIERQGLDIDPNDILVLLDDVSTTASYCSKSSIISPILADVIYQLTGKRFQLLLQLSQYAMRQLEPKQIAYRVYDALRHINKTEDGKYVYRKDHDIQVWYEILPYAAAPTRELPDVSQVALRSLDEVGEGAD